MCRHSQREGKREREREGRTQRKAWLEKAEHKSVKQRYNTWDGIKEMDWWGGKEEKKPKYFAAYTEQPNPLGQP